MFLYFYAARTLIFYVKFSSRSATLCSVLIAYRSVIIITFDQEINLLKFFLSIKVICFSLVSTLVSKLSLSCNFNCFTLISTQKMKYRTLFIWAYKLFSVSIFSDSGFGYSKVCHYFRISAYSFYLHPRILRTFICVFISSLIVRLLQRTCRRFRLILAQLDRTD